MKLRTLRYDKEAGVAYVYFKKIRRGEVALSVDIGNGVVLDLDKNGKFLGMEILRTAVIKKIWVALKKLGFQP